MPIRVKNYDRQIVVRLDQATYDAVAAMALAEERTVAQQVRLMLRRALVGR